MLTTLQTGEAKLERAALWVARLWRFLAEVTDREVLARLGPRGMIAITLPLMALAQALLPRWAIMGGAPLPLIWCGVCYYMIRFRLGVSVEAAVAGALLAWLAAPGSSWPTGAVLFVAALGCGVLRRWLYAEFWPAHAFASSILAFCIPVITVCCGMANPVVGLLGFGATLVTAPLLGMAGFVLLEAVRRRLGLDLEFPAETELVYDPAYVYPPFAASGPGF